jgi:serine/threonine protein kinase
LPETIAHYTILEKLGSGGMGAVFRAHDTRLGRDVALKLLPAELFADPEARAQLVREARLASALNHPNVCTIHEVGEADGQTYLAMELVRGRPLREIIPRDGMPLESLLHYGAQIADALEHAHAQGVVHRDLKASNVVITEDGRAKVLDFGLARRAAAAGGANPAEAQTLTQSGAIAGTPPYLSPEVLRGGAADARSDIWSLGILLYEMASGGLPFRGRTGPELSAAILKDPAPPLPARVPPGLRAVIGRCLEKESARRFRSAGEVRAALEALQSDLRAPSLKKTVGGTRWGPRVAILLVVLLLAGIGTWLALRQPWRPRELKQRQLTSNASDNPVGWASISPDGKTLAVVDWKVTPGVSLRAIDSGESHTLELPPGVTLRGGFFPVVDWYPDGNALLLSGADSSGVPHEWALPILGGRARVLIDNGHLATISKDGSHLAFVRNGQWGADIWLSGPNGESPRRVVASDSTGMITTWAVWAPGGRRLVYVRGSRGAQGNEVWIETCDLEGHSRRAFTSTPTQQIHPLSIPCWLPDGRVVFGLNDPPPSQGDINLWSIRVDPRSGAPSGEPRRITQWQRVSLVEPSGVSRDGTRLGIGVVSYQSDCYVGRVAGRDSMLQGVKRLTLDNRFDLNPNWLPGGDAIVFSSDRSGTEDVFKQGLDATEAEPVATGPGVQDVPSASPDGAWILYIDRESGATPAGTRSARLMRSPITGGPPEEVFDVQPGASFACARPPATRCVLSEFDHGETVFAAFDPILGRGKELIRIPGAGPRPWDLSPDGESIAFVDPQDSLARIQVRSLRGGATRDVAIHRETAVEDLSWTADGRGWIAVCYEARVWQLLRVDEKGNTAALIPPQQWMYSAAMSPDGHHIVYTSNTVDGNFWLLEDF